VADAPQGRLAGQDRPVKQVFSAEAIGLTREQERRYRDAELRRQANRQLRPFVDELTGVMLAGGLFRRRRLKPRADYTHANSWGTRGVWFFWTLECGPIYHTRYRSTWTDWHERYLTVDAQARIIDITEEEARQCLLNAQPQSAPWASTY
jgi:hypothetical protein